MNKSMRILAIGAHAADITDKAGGTLLKYARKGAEIMMVALSLGAKTHVMVKADMEELQEIKRREMQRAYEIIGVKHIRCLEYEEDPITLGRAEIRTLVDIIREFRPSIVLTHHPSTDTVPDHSEVGRAVWHACHCAGRPGFESSLPVHVVRTIYCSWKGVNMRSERIVGAAAPLPSIYIDVSDVIEEKIESMMQFQSQQYTREFMERDVQTLEQHYGMEAGVPYAEPFYNLRNLVLDELPISKGEMNPGRKVEGTEEVVTPPGLIGD